MGLPKICCSHSIKSCQHKGASNEADQASLKDKADESIKLVKLRAEKESLGGHRGMVRDMYGHGGESISMLQSLLGGGMGRSKMTHRSSRQKDP